MLKKLGIQKGVDLTRPQLSIGFFMTLALVVVVMMGAIAVGKYIYTQLSGVTKKVVPGTLNTFELEALIERGGA